MRNAVRLVIACLFVMLCACWASPTRAEETWSEWRPVSGVRGVNYSSKGSTTSTGLTQTYWRIQNTTNDKITIKVIVNGFSTRILFIEPGVTQRNVDDQVIGQHGVNSVIGFILKSVPRATDANAPPKAEPADTNPPRTNVPVPAQPVQDTLAVSSDGPALNLCKPGATVLTGTCTCPKSTKPKKVDARQTKCEVFTFAPFDFANQPPPPSAPDCEGKCWTDESDAPDANACSFFFLPEDESGVTIDHIEVSPVYYSETERWSLFDEQVDLTELMLPYILASTSRLDALPCSDALSPPSELPPMIEVPSDLVPGPQANALPVVTINASPPDDSPSDVPQLRKVHISVAKRIRLALSLHKA